jgi:hypothetical protein
MVDQSTLLSMLEVTVPPDTPLTIHSEVKILEIVGVVSNPDFIKSLNLVEAMVPPSAPATLHGLVKLLSGLGKMNPNMPKETHDTLDGLLENLTKTADIELTFGIFLPIVRSIVSAAAPKRPAQKKPNRPPRRTSSSKRRPRRTQAAAA